MNDRENGWPCYGGDMKDLIYFDNASTTFPKPEPVYRAMEEAGRHFAVNVGRGAYRLAREAFRLTEDTREEILHLVQGNYGAETVFTPSATIACNQVLGGLEWKRADVVYVTPFEHNAVIRVLHHLQKQYGFEVEELAVHQESLEMDREKIRYQFLRKPPAALIMNHVSNVTGAILPWQDIAKLAEEYKAAVIVDGSQALGLVPVCLKHTNVDFYIFAGHKALCGPLGIGGYVNNSGRKLKQILFGGTGSDSLNPEVSPEDVRGYEPGSMNITAIAGLKAAIKESVRSAAEERLREEQRLREGLLEKLNRIPEIQLYPPLHSAAAGIVSLNVEGYQAEEVGILLDEKYGIAVRTGYHCAPLIHKYLKDKEYGGTVRVSLGPFTTEAELDVLAEALEEIAAG